MPSHTAKAKNQTGNIELFELELTKGQLKALSNMLPKGFSLEALPRSTTSKSTSSRPTKKLFTNEGNQVVKKSPKPADSAREGLLINKQALREPGKRKLSTYLDYSYPNLETSTSTSSKVIKLNNEATRRCQNILQKLKKHPCAGPFLRPVDVAGLGLADYYDVVKEPMDLSTVENKLKGAKYNTVEQFFEDIRRIWNNALLYNLKGSQIHVMTLEISGYFEKLLREGDTVAVSDTVRDLEKRVEMLSKQIGQLHQKGMSTEPQELKLNRSASKTSKSAKLMEKPLTAQEKKMLGQNIQKLAPEHLRGVWDIVNQWMNLSGREEVEFDIERLPTNVARELDRFVKNKISLMNRGKNKAKGKEVATPQEVPQTSYASTAFKHHEGEFEPISKGEDEVTTQHHSQMGSDGKPESKEDVNAKGGVSPAASSDSSFISDSDVEDEEEKQRDKTNGKAANALQKQQEIANFFAGSHGSMLNSFIVK